MRTKSHNQTAANPNALKSSVESEPNAEAAVLIEDVKQRLVHDTALTALTVQSPVQDAPVVKLSEFEDQGNWQCNKLSARLDAEYLNYQSADMPKKQIGTVAEVFRGQVVTPTEETGNIRMVRIANMGDYDLDYTGLEYLQEVAEEGKFAPRLLQEGDVLLSAFGTTIRTAVFHQQDFPCIASPILLVIRPNTSVINSTYLKLFLDSPVGKKLISNTQRGKILRCINCQALKIMEVPVPPLDVQQAAAEEYQKELTCYRQTIVATEKRWHDILSKLQSTMAYGTPAAAV